jgi:hypothetical protein
VDASSHHATPARRRTAAEAKGTPRSAAFSLWRSHRPEPPPRNPLDFLTRHVWPWILHYLAVLFRPRRPFPTYTAPPAQRPGILRIPNRCTIGLAADWGTGSASAYRVADQIRRLEPDITIHMGDVYYSGTHQEYRDYFLGSDDWPRGRLATYAMNANHEMYSGGEGYFDLALPTLGQQTSYFCLENEHWRVVAVDTGYYSRTVPFLEILLRGWIRLHRENQRWLAEVAFVDPTDRRPVVLLSHHQWFSAFEAGYDRVGENLSPYLDRVVLWLWGHEHRFAAYSRYAPDRARGVRARCIGHGGMPIEISAHPKYADRNLVCHDARQATVLDGDPIGFCGFAAMHLDGPELRLVYADEKGVKLLEEAWTSTAAGAAGRVLYASPDLTLAPGQSFEALVTT